jgi:quercetin dioxygenase-like cupin family protein
MRRIVTGVDDAGRSQVLSAEELSTSGRIVELWRYEPTDRDAFLSAVCEDELMLSAEPDSGGIRWIMVSFAPGAKTGAEDVSETPPHVTRTIDFVYCLAGELVLILDCDTVRIGAGDLVIQRATRHAWRNESTEPVVLLALVHRPVSADG